MKEYYECHITFERPKDATIIELPNWKFSCIDGDPILGKGVKSYYTRHYNTAFLPAQMVMEMERLKPIIEAQPGHRVLRTKVELVVHDTRYKEVTLND